MTKTIVIEVDAGEAWLKLMRATNKLSGYEIKLFLGTEVAPYLGARVRRRFAVEGDDASRKWDQLRLSTQRFRAAAGYGPKHPINVRTGELYHHAQSFSTKAQMTGATLTMPGSAGSVQQQKKIKQAQRGNPAKKSPARPVLALERYPDSSIIERLFVEFLKRGVA